MRLTALRNGKYYMYNMQCQAASSLSFNVLHREESFRHAYTRFGEIRSLIPSTVNVMALAAMASRETVKTIVKTLGMKTP